MYRNVKKIIILINALNDSHENMIEWAFHTYSNEDMTSSWSRILFHFFSKDVSTRFAIFTNILNIVPAIA